MNSLKNFKLFETNIESNKCLYYLVEISSPNSVKELRQYTSLNDCKKQNRFWLQSMIRDFIFVFIINLCIEKIKKIYPKMTSIERKLNQIYYQKQITVQMIRANHLSVIYFIHLFLKNKNKHIVNECYIFFFVLNLKLFFQHDWRFMSLKYNLHSVEVISTF